MKISFKVNAASLILLVFIASTDLTAQTWNFTNSVEGWIARNNTTLEHSSDNGGQLVMRTYGSDPGMYINLSLSAAGYNRVKMRVATFCSDNDSQIFFKRSGSSSTFIGQRIKLTVPNAYATYEFDMSNDPNWFGTITQIRIDPSDNCGSSSNSGFIAFNWIQIYYVDITVTKPNGGETWQKGSQQTITWNSASVSGNVHIQWYKGGISPSNALQNVTGSTANDGSYSTTVPTSFAAGNDYKIGISDVNTGAIFDFSNNFFTIQSPTPPPPTLTYPPNGVTLNDDTPDLAWSAGGSVNYFQVQIDDNSNFSSPIVNESNWQTLNYTPSPLSDDTYYWRVRSHGTNGLWSDWADRYFIIDTPPPPTLTVFPSSRSVSSSSGSTTFSISSNVGWTASDNVSWLSVSPTSGNGNGTLTATYSSNSSSSSRTATITITGSGITRTVTVIQDGTTLPDFIVSSVNAPSSAAPGQSISVTVSIQNIGSGSGNPGRVEIRLSTNSNITSGDPLLLGYTETATLGSNTGVTVTKTVTIPANAATTTQWVGVIVDANEAHRLGMVNKVTPPDELMETTMDLAQRLANGPTYSMALIKRLIHRSLHTDLAESLRLAGPAQVIARSTEDHREGVRAFVEKREPAYKGR
ncbi:MAG: hypothetical protein IIB14_00335 [Chloroflexi bacterium]|nr:hypothetical protein [Chloroflexota bacterium]